MKRRGSYYQAQGQGPPKRRFQNTLIGGKVLFPRNGATPADEQGETGEPGSALSSAQSRPHKPPWFPGLRVPVWGEVQSGSRSMGAALGLSRSRVCPPCPSPWGGHGQVFRKR